MLGHITSSYNGPIRCGVCSDTHESNMECNPNCGGNHHPLDKDCPLYKQEKSIIKIQTDKEIPPGRARRELRLKARGKYIALPEERKESIDLSFDDSETETGNTETSPRGPMKSSPLTEKLAPTTTNTDTETRERRKRGRWVERSPPLETGQVTEGEDHDPTTEACS